MPKLDLNNIHMLVLWIIPGFISIKVWSMIVATTRKKASEIVIECIIASFFNSIIYTLIKFILREDVVIQKIWFILGTFILPIFLPFILKKILDINWISNLIIDPVPKAWDKIFSSGERFFVIIHMKDGQRVGGFYGENSYVSSYPEIQDIYIESVWKLKKNESKSMTNNFKNETKDKKKIGKLKKFFKRKNSNIKRVTDEKEKKECIGDFESEIEGTRGLWISKEDFKFIEFFEVDEEE